ncbi:MAG: CHAT domain-containing protein [Phormidesmis sp.]
MTTQPDQEVAVVINFLAGSFQEGFKVSLEILKAGAREYQIDDLPWLPPAPDLPILYQAWRSRYAASGGRDIQFVSVMQNCQTAAKALEQALTIWFQDTSFKYLRSQISSKRIVHEDDSVPVIFNFQVSEADHLRRLPWHVWDLFRFDLLNAEVVLQAKVVPRRVAPAGPLRVLAIYGSATGGINTEGDREAWRSLQSRPDVAVTELNQPQTSELRQALAYNIWDIVFFAGHSRSSVEEQSGLPTGTLQIGQFPDGRPRMIAIAQIREDLSRAVQKGLKLAIFNSCDGLGIADLLVQLNVPTAIVMREPVPDLVARRFIQVFLQHFSQNKEFYLAVRAARRELDWLENDYYNPMPSATWLPIVLQNPSQSALQWPQWPPPKTNLSIKKSLLFASTALSILLAVWGLWGLSQRSNGPGKPNPGASGSSLQSLDNYGSSTDSEDASLGEAFLTPQEALPSSCSRNSDRRAAANAMSDGRYGKAEELFETISANCSIDPETQIYRNNAGILRRYLTEGTPFLQASEPDLAALKENVVIIAVGVPLQGDEPDISQEIMRGAVAAQEKINKELNNPREILLQVVNDDSAQVSGISDKAEEMAELLSKDPAIFAVLGHYSSGATEAASRAYNQAEIVAISPTSTAIRQQAVGPNLQSQAIDLGEYIFRTPPDDRVNAEVIVANIKREGKERVLMAYDGADSYSRSLQAVTAQALEDSGIVVDEPICNFRGSGGFEVDNCLPLDLDAQALIFLPSSEVQVQAGRLLDAIASDGLSLPIWAGDAAYSNDNFTEWGEGISGARVAIPWHEFKYNDGTIFPPGEGKNWRSAMAYDALQAIAQGLSQLLENNPGTLDRKDLQQILAAPDFVADGILGPQTIRFEAGDRINTEGKLAQIVEVIPKPNGEAGYLTRPLED